MKADGSSRKIAKIRSKHTRGHNEPLLVSETLLMFVRWRDINARQILTALLSLFCIYLAPLNSFSEGTQGFTVKGRLDYEAYLSNGTNRSWSRTFTVVVQDCSWAIESVDTSSGEFQLTLRTNDLMHSVTKVNPGNDPALNNYYEVIEDDNVPEPDVSGHSVLWLAFASNCYLKSVKDNQYEPVWMLDDPSLRKERFTVRGDLETLEGNLPKTITYLNAGTIYARSAGQRVILHAPPSFKGAVTNAYYTANKTTNIGSIQIPTSFEFERFGISPSFTTHLLTRIKATVTDVQPSAQIYQQIVNLKGISFINDKRFEKTATNLPKISYRKGVKP